MSNFSIASILNLPNKKDDITDMAYLLQQQAVVMTGMVRPKSLIFFRKNPEKIEKKSWKFNLKKLYESLFYFVKFEFVYSSGCKIGSKNRKFTFTL